MTLTRDRLLHCMRGLPPLSAAQLADMLSVPWAYYGDFCRVLREAVAAGRVTCRETGSGGVVVPVFEEARG